MSALPSYRLLLAKEDFKFSVAHFTLFDGTRAELLHGHNYRVSLELAGRELDEWGLLADIDVVKQAVRAICRRLDSRTLLPEHSPALSWRQSEGAVEVRFGPRTYRLPAEDVLRLPLANTSIELLARMFWDELADGLRGTRVETLAVSVEETAGQSCCYEAALG
jgi:6-pyruvoyltetrahydropterin/6-carboxytetrahydropterin synthase